MSVHRISLVVASWGLVRSCVESVVLDEETEFSREPFPATSSTPLPKTLKPLRWLLMASPWLQPGKIKSSNVPSYETLAKRDGVKFGGSYKSVSDMPNTSRPEVTFMGKSNVGKSSALNTLAGVRKNNQLAKVGKTPGRTRMLNLFDVANGKLNFMDVPGYGYAKAGNQLREAWDRNTQKYLKNRPNLKLAIVLIGSDRMPDDLDLDVISFLEDAGIPWVVVATKIDVLKKSEHEKTIERFRQILSLEDERMPIMFSSKTGEGKKKLWRIITDACRR